MVKSDIELKRDVEMELGWDPKVDASKVVVSVSEGMVALTGSVDSYPARLAADYAVRRVYGVRGLKLDLAVKVQTDHARSDSELAAAAESALRGNVLVPKSVTVTVRDGEVSLAGRVLWDFERLAAQRAVHHLKGVIAVHNLITLHHRASSSEVKANVEAALKRQATADASSIHVEAVGDKVTLSGDAASWASIVQANRAAWAAPGVNFVVDHVRLST